VPVLNVTHCLYIAGSDADARSECLRKLSSHTPLFDAGDSTGVGLSPDSEISVESNPQLFGIHPFYIPRGWVFSCLYSRHIENFFIMHIYNLFSTANTV